MKTLTSLPLIAAVVMAACAQPSTPPANQTATSATAPAPKGAANPGDRHPLDPLTNAEIESAAKILRAAPGFPANGAFATIVLNEPPKAEVLAFKAGAPINRQAFSIVLDRPGN